MNSFWQKDMVTPVLFSALVGVIAFGLFRFAIPQYYLTAFPILLLVFALYSIFGQKYLTAAKDLRPQAFLNRFLFLTTAKLFFFLMFVVFYVVVIREKAAVFLIGLLLMYIVFLVFDISCLLHKTRTPNQKNN